MYNLSQEVSQAGLGGKHKKSGSQTVFCQKDNTKKKIQALD
jgi:hypothetical protein